MTPTAHSGLNSATQNFNWGVGIPDRGIGGMDDFVVDAPWNTSKKKDPINEIHLMQSYVLSLPSRDLRSADSEKNKACERRDLGSTQRDTESASSSGETQFTPKRQESAWRDTKFALMSCSICPNRQKIHPHDLITRS